MIISAYFELRQSKEEIFHLLKEQAESLSEIITQSSINTLNSSFEIEDLVTERLLNNARMIRRLDSINALSTATLINFSKENDLFRINVFDKKGNRILSNRIPTKDHPHPEGNVNRYDELEPILTGKTNEFIIGLKPASFSNEQRFAVAISRAFNRGAIVINLDAKDFLEFRKRIGIGKIVQDISDNPGIEYIVLQDSLGILAASSSVKEISAIESDSFLQKAIGNDSTSTRIIPFNNSDVFEVVKGLFFENEFIGIFRIGLTLDEIHSVENRMIRRVIIISVILAAISVIVLGLIFTNQNLKSLSNEFGGFKSFTNSLLENMNEAVFVIDKNSRITLFNNSAKELFEIKKNDVIGEKISELKDYNIDFIQEFINKEQTFKSIQKSVTINNSVKYLSISITPNYNFMKKLESYTVVTTDITESKKMEEQRKRDEKLLAMGELASGVAHEIRNPINSIGMIAQRLNKEFTPSDGTGEYASITNLLKTEVDRINKIITQFLQYAKPIELQKTSVFLGKFFQDIYQLFADQAKQKKTIFLVNGDEKITAVFDPELIKQTLMNIIQNAFDAINNNGKVEINYFREHKNIVITVSDNGSGIPEENRSQIFDLYFTSKKEGNGLGLSISQKIISQHKGSIEFTSSGEGTTFKINLPI
jgi:two-component system sensor histidine kinase HydH